MERKVRHAIRAAAVALAVGVAFAVAGSAIEASVQPLGNRAAGTDRSTQAATTHVRLTRSTVGRSGRGKILANSWALGVPAEWFLVRPDGRQRRTLRGEMTAVT